MKRTQSGTIEKDIPDELMMEMDSSLDNPYVFGKFWTATVMKNPLTGPQWDNNIFFVAPSEFIGVSPISEEIKINGLEISKKIGIAIINPIGLAKVEFYPEKVDNFDAISNN